jgi:hypothetical protein
MRYQTASFLQMHQKQLVWKSNLDGKEQFELYIYIYIYIYIYMGDLLKNNINYKLYFKIF